MMNLILMVILSYNPDVHEAIVIWQCKVIRESSLAPSLKGQYLRCFVRQGDGVERVQSILGPHDIIKVGVGLSEMWLYTEFEVFVYFDNHRKVINATR